MNKIVISGYYGFNNLGDESILTAIVANLKDRIRDVDITVLSQDPGFTREKHGVNAINRRNLFEIIREIRVSDMLISGGGSLLQDVTSFRSIIYYLAVIWIGIVFNKKVLIYSQGMGPINRKINRWLTKRVLDRVDYITLRDHKSENLLREIGIANKNIIITADPVIGLRQVDTCMGRDILEAAGIEDFKRPTICFALRGREKTQNTIDVISRVADRLIEEMGANLVFIPFHLGEDLAILDDIERKISNKAVFLRERYNVVEMLSIIGNFDLQVGIRLHSLIFGAVMNVPLTAISYDPKINNFMEFIEELVYCHINDLEEEGLFNEIRDKLQKEKEYRIDLSKKVEALKKRLSKNEDIIIELLKKG